MKFSSATISLFLFGSLFSLSSAKIDAPVAEEHSHSERRLQRGTQGNFFGVIRNRYQTVFLPRLCRLGLEFVYCVCNESSLNFKLGTGETEIQVCPGATIELTSPIDISGKSFTLSCAEAPCTIQGDGTTQLFTGSPGAVTFKDLSFENGDGGTNANGGAMAFTGGIVNIENASFRENGADNGGAISLEGTTFSARSSFFNENKAVGNGGAIYAVGSTSVTLEDCFLNSNDSGGSGGGLYLEGSQTSATISSLSFLGNEATGSGGAIYAQNSTVTVEDYLFENSLATGNGGAIASQFATINLKDGTFKNNMVTGNGIDIFVVDDTDPTAGGTFIDCKISDTGEQLNDFCNGTSGIEEEGEGTSALGFPTESEFSNTNCETNQISSDCN